MLDVYYAVTAAISGLALLANLLLLFLTFRCPSHGDEYATHATFFTPLLGICYAICYLVIAPVVITREFTFVWFSTGPVGWPYGMIFFSILCMSTFCTVLFVANNFLHRYIILCRNGLLYVYSSTGYLTTGFLFNSLLLLNWMAMNYFGLWPSEDYIKIIKEVWPDGRVNMSGRAYMAISILDGAEPLKVGLLVESMILLFMVALVAPYCATKIHLCLKEKALSVHTKRMHKQVLLLLSIQTACTTLFMHLPLCCMYVLLFSGLHSTVLSAHIIGIFMALHPLFEPIIKILFVHEYRHRLLDTLRIVRRSDSSAPHTDARPKTVTVFVNLH